MADRQTEVGIISHWVGAHVERVGELRLLESPMRLKDVKASFEILGFTINEIGLYFL